MISTSNYIDFTKVPKDLNGSTGLECGSLSSQTPTVNSYWSVEAMLIIIIKNNIFTKLLQFNTGAYFTKITLAWCTNIMINNTLKETAMIS